MHEGLEIGTRFNDWFQRMVEYGFLEGKDFYSKKSKTSEIGGRPSIDYEITVGMAKQICMRDWKTVKISICSKMSGFKLRGVERFSRMCEYGFSDKMDYLEVIVKNDENSKGGSPATGLYDLL